MHQTMLNMKTMDEQYTHFIKYKYIKVRETHPT